ncbi:DUF982 domain-containing protein [Rhizobium rhizogenes]|jgi:hypothetical protein
MNKLRQKDKLKIAVQHFSNEAYRSDGGQRSFAPVRIVSELTDEYQIIDSVEGFAQYLLEALPLRNVEVCEKALQVCIDGLSDRLSPEQVRETLIWMATEECISIIA